MGKLSKKEWEKLNKLVKQGAGLNPIQNKAYNAFKAITPKPKKKRTKKKVIEGTVMTESALLDTDD